MLTNDFVIFQQPSPELKLFTTTFHAKLKLYNIYKPTILRYKWPCWIYTNYLIQKGKGIFKQIIIFKSFKVLLNINLPAISISWSSTSLDSALSEIYSQWFQLVNQQSHAKWGKMDLSQKS